MAKKRLKMSTPREVQRAINRIANLLLNEEIEPRLAHEILYSCNILLGSIRTDDQQKRIDELAKALDELGAST